MVFAVDKLTLCNNALLATGNQPVSVISDGSDEWTAVSNYYDRSLVKVLAAHDWKFALNIAEMTRVGTSAYPGFEDMYALPPDCLLLRAAWDDRDAADIIPLDVRHISRDGINLPAMDYRIIDNFVHCICPQGASCLYVQNPTVDGLNYPVGFCEAVTTEVEALLTRGFNEDMGSLPAIKALAKEALTDGREQDSGQEPRRIIFRSGMLEARRRRRGYTWR